MPDFWMDVDAALSEVPVNIMPLLDDTDFKSREVAIAYDAAGMDLVWNFVTTAGAYTQTAVTPTTGGNYDWAHQGDGMYSIEIPASGGASINNDTEGFGWFTGFVTGVLPWRGPTIGFRAAALNNSMVDGTTIDVNVTAMAAGTITAAAIATGAIDADAIADNAIDAGAIAANAITSAKIATDAIGAAQIAANAIGSSEIADGAITAAKIATDAIDADALADGAITAATFAAGAIDNTAFNVTETLSADVVSISGDTTAADNLEKEYDGTGYGHVLQRTTIATLASQTSFTLTAGSADNDAYNGCIIVIEDASTAAQKAVGVVSDYTGASKTITLLNDPAVFTMATTDIVTIIADRALKATVDNRTLDVSATGEAGLDWANIGSPTTAQNLSATNIDTDQVVASVTNIVTANVTQLGGVAQSLTDLKDFADDGYDPATNKVQGVVLVDTLTTYTGNTVQTGDSFARLGAPAGASVSADILAIDNLVDDLESRVGTPSNLGSGATVAANLVDIEGQTDDIGVAGAGLTAIPWNASWDAEVQSEVDDALVARNLDKLVIVSGTADSGSTTTMVDAARTEADNDYWKGRIILFTSGNISGECAIITDFVAGTDTFTFAPPTTQAVSTQNYVILPGISVWDDTLAEHLIAGSTGSSLNSAGSAGDPWNTALPGAYGAGSAGFIVGTNIDVATSSRLAPTVASRTLDVSAGGEAGLDWANIGSPTTAQNLSATNIDVDQVVASVSGAVGSVGAGGITAASIATGAIDADSLAADAGTEIGTAVWASADRQLTALDEDVTTLDLNNTAIGSVVSGVTVTTNNDKTGYALSAAGVQAIWDALTAALTTVGSIGKLLVDNINATISSRSSHSAADVWAVATRLLTAGTNIVLAKGVGVTGFNDPTSADNADAVWDEARSEHSTQGTYGESFFSIESGSAVAGTLSTTQMTTNLTEATDDHYNGRIIIWVSGTLTRQATDITNYDGATKRLDYTAVTESPLAGDRFIIV